jgi:hypothetical protein
MTRLTISTAEELRDRMAIVKGAPVDDNQLCWFVCVQEARATLDLGIKDIASLFSDGIEPINTLDKVQEYINTLYEFEEDGTIDWNNEFNDDQLDFLIDAVYSFYGKASPNE